MDRKDSDCYAPLIGKIFDNAVPETARVYVMDDAQANEFNEREIARYADVAHYIQSGLPKESRTLPKRTYRAPFNSWPRTEFDWPIEPCCVPTNVYRLCKSCAIVQRRGTDGGKCRHCGSALVRACLNCNKWANRNNWVRHKDCASVEREMYATSTANGSKRKSSDQDICSTPTKKARPSGDNEMEKQSDDEEEEKRDVESKMNGSKCWGLAFVGSSAWEAALHSASNEAKRRSRKNRDKATLISKHRLPGISLDIHVTVARILADMLKARVDTLLMIIMLEPNEHLADIIDALQIALATLVPRFDYVEFVWLVPIDMERDRLPRSTHQVLVYHGDPDILLEDWVVYLAWHWVETHQPIVDIFAADEAPGYYKRLSYVDWRTHHLSAS